MCLLGDSKSKQVDTPDKPSQRCTYALQLCDSFEGANCVSNLDVGLLPLLALLSLLIKGIRHVS